MKLVFIFLISLAGGGRAANIDPTSDVIQFLKTNLTAIWEELTELKQEVWKRPYRHHDQLQGVPHSQNHLLKLQGNQQKWYPITPERKELMQHEWEVHHGGVEEENHNDHHNERALWHAKFHRPLTANRNSVYAGKHNIQEQEQSDQVEYSEEEPEQLEEEDQQEEEIEGEKETEEEQEETEEQEQETQEAEQEESREEEELEEEESYDDEGTMYEEEEEPFDVDVVETEYGPHPDYYYMTGSSDYYDNYYDFDDDEGDDDEDYIKALCRMRPNRGIPRRERQPVKGKVIIKQKKSGGPVTYTVNLSGFPKEVSRKKRHLIPAGGGGGRHLQKGRRRGRYNPYRRRGGGYRGTQWHVQMGRYPFPQEYNVLDTPHGFHIHENGDLGNNDCGLAGGHFNPLSKHHGGLRHSDRHVGDLGNVLVTSDGKVKNQRIVDDVSSMTGRNSIIGRSLVVHEFEDDLGINEFNEGSLTTGNSGPRMACCVIKLQ